jgi:hypothetical protein
LKTAIFLYVEANQGSGGTEGAIILAQSALELLAAQDGINRISHADGRIRQLLKDKKIPVEIPLDTTDLKNFCENQWPHESSSDGPKVITYIRNKITHSSGTDTRCLQNIENKIKFQTLWLFLIIPENTQTVSGDFKRDLSKEVWVFINKFPGVTRPKQLPKQETRNRHVSTTERDMIINIQPLRCEELICAMLDLALSTIH